MKPTGSRVLLCQGTTVAKAQTGCDPRLSALIREIAGIQSTRQSLIQVFYSSMLGFPLADTIQKATNRITLIIQVRYDAITRIALHTHWATLTTLASLETAEVAMGDDLVRDRLMSHRPCPSKTAFWALIKDWNGILVSDGCSVYQTWVSKPQTCLPHRGTRVLSQ